MVREGTEEEQGLGPNAGKMPGPCRGRGPGDRGRNGCQGGAGRAGALWADTAAASWALCADSVGSRAGAGSVADSVASRTGADSVGPWTGAGSEADSVGSRTQPNPLWRLSCSNSEPDWCSPTATPLGPSKVFGIWRARPCLPKRWSRGRYFP